MTNSFQPDGQDEFLLYFYAEADGTGETVLASGPHQAFERLYGCRPEEAGATVELIGQNKWRIVSRRGHRIIVSTQPPGT
jgi:hypothetical protein